MEFLRIKGLRMNGLEMDGRSNGRWMIEISINVQNILGGL